VAHVIATDLAGRVCETIRIHAGFRVQQQARRFDRVTGDADNPGLLLLLITIAIGINNRGYLARFVMLDFQDLCTRAQIEIASFFGLRDFTVHGRPLGIHFAALEAEAELAAVRSAIPTAAVDRHTPCVAILVTELFGTGIHHLEIVIAGQPGMA
jgi:hypothetical protein